MSAHFEENAEDAEKAVQVWKIKKLIKNLEAARGNGTSMISLILPPKGMANVLTLKARPS
jgi:peptide subunit release factor 1 (eRF1)